MPSNAERQAAAEAKIRAAVAHLEADGCRVTLQAVVDAAGCSKSTAAKVLRELREAKGNVVALPARAEARRPAAPAVAISEHQVPATVRVRQAIERLEAEGRTVTLKAIMDLAGCSISTASEGRKRLQQERAGILTPEVMEPKPLGRPSKLTEQVIEAVAEGVRLGLPLEVAAWRASISRMSIWEWMKRATNEPGSIFDRFAEAVQKADSEAIERNLDIVQQAAAQSWQAAAWILERRHPQWFGRRDALAVVDSEGDPVKVEIVYEANWRKPSAV